MKMKIKILLTMVMISLLTLTSSFGVSAKEYKENVINENFDSNKGTFLIPGDMDEDGTVDTDDLNDLRKILLTEHSDWSYNAIVNAEANGKFSDVNGDSCVDIRDLVCQKINEENTFINEGKMNLYGNSSLKEDFISSLGTGATYQLSVTYSASSDIEIYIPCVSKEYTLSKDNTSFTETFKTSTAKLSNDNKIGFRIAGRGKIESISVKRINMDNDYSVKN